MNKRIRTALAALLIAFAIAFSANAFGFSQADVGSSSPPPKGAVPSKLADRGADALHRSMIKI